MKKLLTSISLISIRVHWRVQLYTKTGISGSACEALFIRFTWDPSEASREGLLLFSHVLAGVIFPVTGVIYVDQPVEKAGSKKNQKGKTCKSCEIRSDSLRITIPIPQRGVSDACSFLLYSINI
jgi:hypothetical protein